VLSRNKIVRAEILSVVIDVEDAIGGGVAQDLVVFIARDQVLDFQLAQYAAAVASQAGAEDDRAYSHAPPPDFNLAHFQTLRLNSDLMKRCLHDYLIFPRALL